MNMSTCAKKRVAALVRSTTFKATDKEKAESLGCSPANDAEQLYTIVYNCNKILISNKEKKVPSDLNDFDNLSDTERLAVDFSRFP